MGRLVDVDAWAKWVSGCIVAVRGVTGYLCREPLERQCRGELPRTIPLRRFDNAPCAIRATVRGTPGGFGVSESRAADMADRSVAIRWRVVCVVHGVSGRVPMRMRLRLRVDCGHIMPWVRRESPDFAAVAGPDAD